MSLLWGLEGLGGPHLPPSSRQGLDIAVRGLGGKPVCCLVRERGVRLGLWVSPRVCACKLVHPECVWGAPGLTGHDFSASTVGVVLTCG